MFLKIKKFVLHTLFIINFRLIFNIEIYYKSLLKMVFKGLKHCKVISDYTKAKKNLPK